MTNKVSFMDRRKEGEIGPSLVIFFCLQRSSLRIDANEADVAVQARNMAIFEAVAAACFGLGSKAYSRKSANIG